MEAGRVPFCALADSLVMRAMASAVVACRSFTLCAVTAVQFPRLLEKRQDAIWNGHRVCPLRKLLQRSSMQLPFQLKLGLGMAQLLSAANTTRGRSQGHLAWLAFGVWGWPDGTV